MQISGSTILDSYQSATAQFQVARNVPGHQVHGAEAAVSTDVAGEQVSISAQAKMLLQQEQYAAQNRSAAVTLPANENAAVDTYLQLKKTQLKYQVAADAINLASGNNQGISAATAYTLANNDAARANVVDLYQVQNQAKLFEQYIDYAMQSDAS